MSVNTKEIAAFVVTLHGMQDRNDKIVSQPLSEEEAYSIQESWVGCNNGFFPTTHFSTRIGEVERLVINQSIKDNFILVISEFDGNK